MVQLTQEFTKTSVYHILEPPDHLPIHPTPSNMYTQHILLYFHPKMNLSTSRWDKAHYCGIRTALISKVPLQPTQEALKSLSPVNLKSKKYRSNYHNIAKKWTCLFSMSNMGNPCQIEIMCPRHDMGQEPAYRHKLLELPPGTPQQVFLPFV